MVSQSLASFARIQEGGQSLERSRRSPVSGIGRRARRYGLLVFHRNACGIRSIAEGTPAAHLDVTEGGLERVAGGSPMGFRPGSFAFGFIGQLYIFPNSGAQRMNICGASYNHFRAALP